MSKSTSLKDFEKNLLREIKHEKWKIRAACRGLNPEMFMPTRGYVDPTPYEVCASCPVTEECLQYALEHDERTGIWGGTSGKDRRQIRKDQHLHLYTKRIKPHDEE